MLNPEGYESLYPCEAEPEFSLSDDSSVPVVYADARLRELAVPVRLRMPLDRVKPRDGDTDVAEGEVLPVCESVCSVDSVSPRYDVVVVNSVLDTSSTVSLVARPWPSLPPGASLNEEAE